MNIAMPGKRGKLSENSSPTERLVFFSDGVFAIAITLLVLEIRLPNVEDIKSDTALQEVLWSILPHFLAFVFSFLMIGQYWILHTRMFNYIKRADRRLIINNLYFLLFICFVPFPTLVLSEHGDLQTATIFYALSLSVSRLIATWMWLHATNRHRLVDPRLKPEIIKYYLLRSLSAPVVFLLSIPVSFFSLTLTYFSWGLIWVLTMLLNWLFSYEETTEIEESSSEEKAAEALAI
jgi:uncharacterized membrane protein